MPARKPQSQQEPREFSAPIELEYERMFRAADGTLLAADAEGTDGAEEVFDITISSDAPVLRSFGLERLLHTEAAVDMSLAGRGLSALLEHGGRDAPFSVDPDMHVGIVEGIRIQGGRLRGLARIDDAAPRGASTRAQLRNKTRIWVSLGYMRLRKPKLEKPGANGDPDQYVTQRWMPCEVSFVSVPADANAHVGRSAVGDPDATSPGAVTSAEEESNMKQVLGDGGVAVEVADSDPRPAIDTRSAGGGDMVAVRNKQVGEIVALCVQNGLQTRAAEWLEAGLTVDQVKGRILDVRSTKGDFGQVSNEALAKFPAKEAKEYSFTRAVRCALAMKEGGRVDGFEAEVDQEIRKLARESGIETHGGMFIPHRLRDALPEGRTIDNSYLMGSRDTMVRETRASAMGPAIPGGGAEIVATTMMELIDLLRNQAKCTRLGARVIPGVVGNVYWPRWTSDPAVRWMGTNPGTAAAVSAPSFKYVLATPKTMIGSVPFPRQLVNLSNLNVEAEIKRTIVISHQLALDLAALSGTGTDAQPLGVLNNPDVQSLAITSNTVTFPKLLTGEGMALAKNVPGAWLGYMTTPQMAAWLRGVPKASNYPLFVWEGQADSGTLIGYPGESTNQLVPDGSANHPLVLGAWSAMAFVLWGALELVVDNLTLADYGQLKIVTYQNGDVVNQRPESFVLHTGAQLK